MFCNNIHRYSIGPILALALFTGVGETASAAGDRICKHALTFADVKFSPMHPETMQRTWTATVLVDASRFEERTITPSRSEVKVLRYDLVWVY